MLSYEASAANGSPPAVMVSRYLALAIYTHFFELEIMSEAYLQLHGQQDHDTHTHTRARAGTVYHLTDAFVLCRWMANKNSSLSLCSLAG